MQISTFVLTMRIWNNLQSSKSQDSKAK